MKIYTKTGDKGMTSLVGGARVSKTHVRLEAYGTLDELNAQLGVLCAYLVDGEDVSNVQWIQKKLFIIGTLFATEDSSSLKVSLTQIEQSDISKLERLIDSIQNTLQPCRSFIIPGGSRGSAFCHVCRTVCRRAERRTLAMREEGCIIDDNILTFLNRMSDYLFVLSRKTNSIAGFDDFYLE